MSFFVKVEDCEGNNPGWFKVDGDKLDVVEGQEHSLGTPFKTKEAAMDWLYDAKMIHNKRGRMRPVTSVWEETEQGLVKIPFRIDIKAAKDEAKKKAEALVKAKKKTKTKKTSKKTKKTNRKAKIQ